MEDKKILGVKKNIFFLGLTSFFNDISSEMIVSIFPAFFTSVLKSGAASLGLVEGIADGAANFIKIYSGKFSDKIGRRRPLIFSGYGVSVFSRPLYLMCTTIGGVLGLRIADRIGKGLREPARDAIISLSSDKENIGVSFGFHRTMDTMGAILGPLVAYLILRQFPNDFNKVFIVAFIAGLVAIATLFFITETMTLVKSKDLSLGPIKSFPKKFKLYILSTFILSSGSIPVAILVLKTQSIGLLISSIPLFYMIYNISYAFFSIIAGKMSDAIGSRKIIMLGYLSLILSYAGLYYSETTMTLVATFLFLGLFPAMTDGTQRAYTAELTNEETRGGAYGLFNAVSGFGAIVSGALGGYLWQHFGPLYTIVIASITVVVGLIIFLSISEE